MIVFTGKVDGDNDKMLLGVVFEYLDIGKDKYTYVYVYVYICISQNIHI